MVFKKNDQKGKKLGRKTKGRMSTLNGFDINLCKKRRVDGLLTKICWILCQFLFFFLGGGGWLVREGFNCVVHHYKTLLKIFFSKMGQKIKIKTNNVKQFQLNEYQAAH